MYQDYYAILNLHFSASHEEIKKAYRQLAKKWHPDINPSESANSKMQEIVEAYLVLSDPEARSHYDIIHEQLYRAKKQSSTKEEEKYYSEKYGTSSSARNENQYKSSTIPVDPILDNWIGNARKQAKEFIIQSIKDTKGITANGCKYTLYAIAITILLFITLLIIASIIGQKR
jgi:DnaJ-class molecular chaperone